MATNNLPEVCKQCTFKEIVRKKNSTRILSFCNKYKELCVDAEKDCYFKSVFDNTEQTVINCRQQTIAFNKNKKRVNTRDTDDSFTVFDIIQNVSVL